MSVKFESKIKPKFVCPSCGRNVLTLHSGRCIQCKCEETIPQIKITKLPTRGLQ